MSLYYFYNTFRLFRKDLLRSCKVHCEEGVWGDYEACDKDTGKQKRTRSIKIPQLNGGNSCGDLEEERDCPRWVSSGGSWGNCSDPCGTGTQTRSISTCKDSNGNTVSDSNCDIDVKPTTSQSCNTQTCLTKQ